MTSLTKAATAAFDDDDSGPQNEREDIAFAAQVDFAFAAREAGVRLRWPEFVQCTAMEQRAWVKAGRMFQAQEARRIALAQRQETGYLLAGADTEGTLEADRAAVRAYRANRG